MGPANGLKTDEPTLPSLKDRSWEIFLVTHHLVVKLEILILLSTGIITYEQF